MNREEDQHGKFGCCIQCGYHFNPQGVVPGSAGEEQQVAEKRKGDRIRHGIGESRVKL